MLNIANKETELYGTASDERIELDPVDFLVKRDALLAPIKSVIGVVELRQVIPILANIKLVASGNTLTLTATDSKIELSSQTTLVEPVETTQSITLPGRKLMEICRTLPESSTIHLFTQDHWACIQSEDTQFKLTALPASSFPSVKLTGEVTSFLLSQSIFHQSLSRTHFAMAQQDVRYFLNGVCFEVAPDYVKFVATDGHRLALNTSRNDTGVETSTQVIIPQKAVTELLRLLSEESEENSLLSIHITKNHIQIKNNRLTFTATLIDAQYPPYPKVIPSQGNKEALIHCKSFKEALNRATILTHERFRGVRLDFKSETLKILSYNVQQESSQENMPITYQGDPISISFNLSYLIDVLSVVRTKKIKMTLSTFKHSVLLEEFEDKEKPETEKESLFVIMPVTL